eukprot:9756662-Karenia_brevis.AAC.1
MDANTPRRCQGEVRWERGAEAPSPTLSSLFAEILNRMVNCRSIPPLVCNAPSYLVGNRIMACLLYTSDAADDM